VQARKLELGRSSGASAVCTRQMAAAQWTCAALINTCVLTEKHARLVQSKLSQWRPFRSMVQAVLTNAVPAACLCCCCCSQSPWEPQWVLCASLAPIPAQIACISNVLQLALQSRALRRAWSNCTFRAVRRMLNVQYQPRVLFRQGNTIACIAHGQDVSKHSSCMQAHV
jgi:hypothetical protein